MATAATGTVQAPSGNPVLDLLRFLGGTQGTQTTTQSPADISGLQQLQAQLQGADYNALLQSIFQQAAGQIPGLQSATTRAVGARTRGNAATDAALQSLLQQTTIAAQDKITQQMLQNQQLQAQAGQAVATATKGTTQTTKASEGTNLQKIAGMLALLQAATKLTGSNTVQEMIGKVTGTATAPSQQPVAAQPQAAPAQQISQVAPRVAAATAPMAAAQVPVVDYSRPAMLEPSLQIPQLVQTPYTAPMGGQVPSFDIYDVPAEVPMAAIPSPVIDFGAPMPQLVNGIDIMNYPL